MRRVVGMIGLLISGVVLAIGAFFLYDFIQRRNYPERKEEFEMQGLMWSTIAYYYDPFVYWQVYNPVANILTVNRAKSVGVDWLLLKAFYSGSAEGEVLGNDKHLESGLRQAIAIAHARGLKVFLVPFVDSHDYWVLKEWTLSPETWTPVVLKWASFAEENGVEMFAPGVEMGVIFDRLATAEWHKEILPKIREVYSGMVATAEHNDLAHDEVTTWEFMDEQDAFVGYDCLGATLFPRMDYDGENDIRSLEDYKNFIEEKASFVDATAERYGVDCKIAAILGMDFWQGGEPDEAARAAGYSAAMDVLKDHGFTGVFLHKWREVESVLKGRWVEEP